MTRIDAKKFLPLIKAFVEDKNIEVYNGNDWFICNNPSFTGDINNYRIKK
jgi:hypothetical protein